MSEKDASDAAKVKESIANLLSYTGAAGKTDIASLIISGPAKAVEVAYSDHPEDIGDETIKRFADIVNCVMSPQGVGISKFSNKIIEDIQESLKTAPEEKKKLIEECIRITPMKTISGATSDKESLKHFINSNYLYDNAQDWTAEKNHFTLSAAYPSRINDSMADSKEEPTKSRPNVVAIELLKPGLTATSRDTREVSVFTNLITPLEMSRCVPFFRVRFVPPSSSVNIKDADKAKIVGSTPFFNIIGFLKGSPPDTNAVDTNSLDFYLSTTNFNDRTYHGGGSMELFTTPQTMMTMKKYDSNFPNKILDRSRPFMTITGAKVKVVPTAGWYSYKTATIDIVLHDRSRLNLVAPFIKPDLLAGETKVTVEMEYGWSHPDGGKTTSGGRVKNPMGTFLNGLRCKENYEVYNSSFSFADSGQVNISLQLVMKSHTAMAAKPITITDVRELTNEVAELTKSLNQAMKDGEKNTNYNTLKEVYGEIIMNGVSSADAALAMPLKDYEALKKNVETIKNGSVGTAQQKISSDILTLLGKVKQAQDNASKFAEEKLNALDATTEIFPIRLDASNKPVSKSIKISSTSEKKTDVVSLGKVLHAFLAAPLAATNEFAEVQLIFGVHSERAGFVRSLSVARFPISVSALKTDISEFIKKKPKMTPLEFISMLNEKHVSNPSAFAHGFSEILPAKADGKEETKPTAETLSKQSAIIKESGILDEKSRMPRINIVTECVSNGNPDKPILKIFVTDATAINNQSYVDFLKAARDTNSQAISGAGISSTHPLIPQAPEAKVLRKNNTELLKFLQDKGIITSASTETGAPPASGQSTTSSVSKNHLITNASQLKKVVAKGLPYIRFGQAGGMISSIGVTGMQDAGLANAALTTAGQTNSFNAVNAEQFKGVPMSVTPSELSMEILGCPIVNLMQSFFIDLDTLTSLDGIYTVSGLDHNISPGSFTTSVKLLNTGDAYAAFRTPGQDLNEAVSRWLQTDADATKAEEDAKKKAGTEAEAAKTKKSAKSGKSKAAPLTDREKRINTEVDRLIPLKRNEILISIRTELVSWMRDQLSNDTPIGQYFDDNLRPKLNPAGNQTPLVVWENHAVTLSNVIVSHLGVVRGYTYDPKSVEKVILENFRNTVGVTYVVPPLDLGSYGSNIVSKSKEYSKITKDSLKSEATKTVDEQLEREKKQKEK